MKTFLIFSFAVFGVSISSCDGRTKRQIWPGQGPDFFSDFRPGPRPFNGFGNVDNFWMRPPTFDQRPGNQNGFVRDDYFDDFNSNSVNSGSSINDNNSGNNGGNRRRTTTTTTENLGPITSTPRTIHTAPQNCECPMTQQFNPVCGTDGNTYRNKGLLNCYQRCGRRVSQKRLGTC